MAFSLASICTIVNLIAQQEGMIKGTVIDRETKKPIVDANIMLGATNEGTSSDSIGQFRMRVRSDRLNILLVSHVGYQKDVYRVFLDNQNEINITIPLKQQPIELKEFTVTSRKQEAFEEKFASRIITEDYIQLTGLRQLDHVINRQFPLYSVSYALYVNGMRKEPEYLQMLDPYIVRKVTIWRSAYAPLYYEFNRQRYVVEVKTK